MPTPEEIEAFKQAFRLKADEKYWGPRWEKAAHWFQTQTSLAPIVTALDKLKTTTTQDNLDKVNNAINGLSKGKKKRYDAALKLLQADLAKVMVEEDTVGDMRLGKLPDGTLIVRGADGKDFVPFTDKDGRKVELTKNKQDFIKSVLTELGKLGVPIDNVGKLVQTIAQATDVGGDGVFAGSIWEEAVNYVKTTVLGTLANDQAELENAGLLPKGAVLKGIEFTGSDFHKGGKQVLFVRYVDNQGKEKKVVYKPSSLAVDSLLFGSDGVAAKLGGISTYNVVAMKTNNKPPKDAGYGYMEFVDTGGGAKTPDDVKGIFVEMAANMAMAYYVGFDDVHQENVLVKSSGVQIIDMEATTGVFAMVDAKGKSPGIADGGFMEQLWGKAFFQGVFPELQKLAAKQQLTELPKLADVKQAMKQRFEQVISKMADKKNKSDLEALEKELAKQTTRTVPIATNIFRKVFIDKAKDYDNLTKWRKMLDDDLRDYKDLEEDDANKEKSVLHTAKGTTSTPLSTIKNLLYTKGVYDALRKGEVPYYSRELGSDKVKDEQGEEIPVPGYPKVGDPIGEAMKKRRKDDPAEIVRIFEMQAGHQVNTIYDRLGLPEQA